MIDPPEKILEQRVKQLLKNKKCWYVACGGCTGSTFSLSFGKQIKRRTAIPNNVHTDDFKYYSGEITLYIWCVWRLDGKIAPVTSSDDSDEAFLSGLERLVGERVQNAELFKPGWDLALDFSNDLRLKVFCDHVPTTPSLAGNWDLEMAFPEKRTLILGQAPM